MRLLELTVNAKATKFSFSDLSDEEQEQLYELFKVSYEKATGAAFSQSQFYSRAQGWIFFGNADPIGGGIAVRKQNQMNAFKLNASYGNPLAVLAGWKEMRKLYPTMAVWGGVTDEIAKMILSRDKDFKVAPPALLRILLPSLKHVSPDIVGIGKKGLKVQTPAGVMDKCIIANTAYYQHILQAGEDPKYQSSIPLAARLALKPALGILRMLLGVKKPSGVDEKSRIRKV
jgi:hypothetical protein